MRNILIVKLSSLGDVIQTLPALLVLRRHYPDAFITWVIEEEAAEILADHPLLDRVLVSRRKAWLGELKRPRRWFQVLREARAFVRALRDRSYDLVIDFQGLLKSGLVVGLCRAKQKRGFAPAREKAHIFLNDRVPCPPRPEHAVDRYLRLLTPPNSHRSLYEFVIPVQQIQRNRVLEYFRAQGIGPHAPLVLLHPGTRWETKLWKEEKWAQLGDLLRDRQGAQVIFTGSEGDFPLVQRIIRRMKVPVLNSAGKWGLRELAFLQAEADVVVVPDSGPMHLAVAMETPVVALFGPTDPALTGPRGKIHRILVHPVDCRPCFHRKCSDPKCMNGISVEEVWEATEPYLAQFQKLKVLSG